MKIQTSLSQQPSPQAAAQELRAALGGTPSLVVYFASSHHAPAETAAAMAEAFPGATTLGCTTAGELGAGRMTKRSIVAMAFAPEALASLHVELVKQPGSPASVEAAVKAFEAKLGTPAAELDHTRYVGLVLMDGLSRSEEALMDRLGDLTNVTFIGGSAGDDLAFARTHVFLNGEAHTDAALLALLEPTDGFAILKTQSFKVLDRTLTVTAADAALREVISFNGKPAREAYAEAIGCAPEALAASFMRNPVGLVVAGEPFVRSPQRLNEDRVAFYCNVLDGMELKLLEAGDIVADTKQAVEQAVEALGGVSGLLNFHCILRTLELEAQGQTEAYGAIFDGLPAIGFSTYGEAYLGHINQTSTMLLLK